MRNCANWISIAFARLSFRRTFFGLQHPLQDPRISPKPWWTLKCVDTRWNGGVIRSSSSTFSGNFSSTVWPRQAQAAILFTYNKATSCLSSPVSLTLWLYSGWGPEVAVMFSSNAAAQEYQSRAPALKQCWMSALCLILCVDELRPATSLPTCSSFVSISWCIFAMLSVTRPGPGLERTSP